MVEMFQTELCKVHQKLQKRRVHTGAKHALCVAATVLVITTYNYQISGYFFQFRHISIYTSLPAFEDP